MSTDHTAAPTVVTLPPLGPGAVLNDRYHLERCLASGGYGDVWACRDEVEGRPVALKILRTDAGNNDPSALARMRQEAEILQAIEHPNIVSVYALESSDYGEFLVMELLDGLAIDQLLQAEGPADEERVVPIVRQLLRALEHAHQHEILHRDIKPENIILEQSPEGERAKLLDFGIAKVHRLLRDADEGVTLVRTRAGGFIGTPRYSAPEQAVGDPIGPSVDLFSLGLVLAEWLTGRQRLDGERYSDVISALLSPDPLDLSDVPARWRGWLGRMTDKLPESRLQTAEQALVAFEQLVVGAHKPAAFVEEARFPGELDLDGEGEFSAHDGPLELDYERVRAKAERWTPPPTPGGFGEDALPERTREYRSPRHTPNPGPGFAPRIDSPAESGEGGEAEEDSLLVNIGWVVGAFLVTCALVFILMWIIRGS